MDVKQFRDVKQFKVETVSHLVDPRVVEWDAWVDCGSAEWTWIAGGTSPSLLAAYDLADDSLQRWQRERKNKVDLEGALREENEQLREENDQLREQNERFRRLSDELLSRWHQ